MKKNWVVAGLAPLASTFLCTPAHSAVECQSSADAGAGYVGLTVDCAAHEAPTSTVAHGLPGGLMYDAYEWRAAEPSCAAITCAAPDCDPPEIYMGRWARLANGGGWTPLLNECHDPTGMTQPTVTPAHVLHALTRVGLPPLEVHTNPETKTLVNLDTIFYTDPTPVRRNLTILGQAVQVQATPTRYEWQFGDEESESTHSPGAPYPSLEITHRYQHAGVTVRPSVDTTYSARFRVNGGGWQDVNGTVTITGPSRDLRVAEATPVLSGER